MESASGFDLRDAATQWFGHNDTDFVHLYQQTSKVPPVNYQQKA